MNPHFQRGVAYGDRFDAEILAGLRAGQSQRALAASLGVSQFFISCRVRVLGCDTSGKSSQRRRATPSPCAARLPPIPLWAAALTITNRPDKGPSRLARTLRGRVVILDRDGLDPSHGVACLHAAGLTLPEIERLTGVPARAAVEAIRRHSPSPHTAEARP